MSYKVVSSNIVLCVCLYVFVKRVCKCVCQHMCMYMCSHMYTHLNSCIHASTYLCVRTCVTWVPALCVDTLKLVRRCRILSKQTVPKLRAIEFD